MLTAVAARRKITASISLVSDEKTGGRFGITAATADAPCKLTVPAAPVDCILNLAGTTSNAPASVALPPAYEGSFKLTTTLAPPKLTVLDVKDPSGKGRKRDVEQKLVGDELDGSVVWTDTQVRPEVGSVTLQSETAPVSLTL